jgi:hypothetical protein
VVTAAVIILWLTFLGAFNPGLERIYSGLGLPIEIHGGFGKVLSNLRWNWTAVLGWVIGVLVVLNDKWCSRSSRSINTVLLLILFLGTIAVWVIKIRFSGH